MAESKKTAALIIIGDEILSGRVRDENSPFLIEKLAGRGIQVLYSLTIPDDPEIIAETVATYSKRVTWCFTAGGMGPTPDDITVESIANAFQVPVVRHPLLIDLIQTICGPQCTPEHLKMAEVPQGSLLHETNHHFFPALQYRNIFILPGVPKFLKGIFNSIQDRFQGRINPIKEIDLQVEEGRITSSLQETLKRFPEAKIGSYPRYDQKQQRVKIILEHEEEGYLNEVYEFLLNQVGQYRWVD